MGCCRPPRRHARDVRDRLSEKAISLGVLDLKRISSAMELRITA